jgi:hypothetical protein
MKKMIVIIFIFLYLSLQSGCGKKTEILAPDQQVTRIQFNLSGVKDPGANAVYYMWAAYDSAKVPLTKFIGDFRIDNQGNSSPSIFDVKLGIIQKATTLVTSIEHVDSLPQEASNSKVLAANLVANHANFSIGDEYLLDFNEASATGSYQVIQARESDSVKGIWFMTGDTLKEAGLDLPEAAPGWRYEGYVVVNGDSFPTGFFYNPGTADRESKYGLNLPTFPFPGENFEIDPVDSTNLNIDLRGAEVIIKIIPPVPDFAEKPYELIMFLGTVPMDASENNNYQLINNSEGFPSGNAELIITMFE